MKNILNTTLFFFAFIHFVNSQDTKPVQSSSTNKYEAYFNYQVQYLTAGTSSYKSIFTRSSQPFDEPYEVGDIIYYYRDYYKARHTFKSNISIQGGISHSKSLFERVNFYYGIGFNYQDIDYKNTIDTTSLAVRKGEVIQVGGTVQPTLINYEVLVDESSDLNTLFGSSYDAKHLKLLNLHLPFGFEAGISKKINLKTGISINIPIWTEVTLENKYGVIFFPGQERQSPVEKNNSSVFFNNALYAMDVEISYNIYKRVSLTVNYSQGLNSLMRDLSETEFEYSFANVGQVNLKSLGIGLKYEF